MSEQWRDVEAVPTPDLPAAKAAHDAARAVATDALERWRGQQDKQDRSYVSTRVLPRSEYRLKWSKDGTVATVQCRRITPK